MIKEQRGQRGLPPTKLAGIKAALENGNARAAILLAAKFQDLGDQRDRILSAREAYLRPAFQLELGRDLKKLKAAGLAALKERYDL